MGQQKEDIFFKIWTCKEAFLKANGSGLTIPINLVDTYIEPDGSARLTALGDNLEQAENWRLELFKPAQGFQAALAIYGHDGEIIFQH
jgi:4'-phosphopantetheinyl transferase